MSDTANVGEKESQLQTYRNDELYNWDLVSFLVDGYVFKMPRYQFVLGSEWFTTRYLQPNAGGEGACAADSARGETEGFIDLGMVPLEGVTASQFRTFLKLLFPIHSISTTLTLIKPEWHTILTLSTIWHFLETRKLAISNLDPQMDDPIELITVGRAEYIPRWVMAGYEALTSKLGAITEEEAGAIGYQTAVRLYIVRHELSGGEQKEKRMKKKLCALFKEEMKALKRGEDERKVPSERPQVEVAQEPESKPEVAKVLVESERRGKDELEGKSEAPEGLVEEAQATPVTEGQGDREKGVVDVPVPAESDQQQLAPKKKRRHKGERSTRVEKPSTPAVEAEHTEEVNPPQAAISSSPAQPATSPSTSPKSLKPTIAVAESSVLTQALHSVWSA